MNAPKARQQDATQPSFRLLLEYDGGRYAGWQRQGPKQTAAGVKTIAGTLDRLLHRAGIKVLHIAGSGRTDAGVHALGQVASIQLARPMKASDVRLALEGSLPHDISVLGLEPCPPEFDPRRDAISRAYLYQIALRKSAFAKNYTWWPKAPLDLRQLEKAWGMFEGSHSMAAFADLTPEENPHCQIYKCETRVCGNILLLRVTGKFFFRKQVRRMVGAAAHCAMGKAGLEQIKRDIKTPKGDSALFWAERAAPAAGLFLESVSYPGGADQEELSPVLKIL
jgi:tRNA pseudouridine38-40 synthase